MKKRLLASLMCLCLVIGLLPATALAAEGQQMTGEEFLALAKDGVITLEQDVILTSSAKISADVTIKLNNHTLTRDTTDVQSLKILMLDIDAGAVTIEGPGTVTGGEFGDIDLFSPKGVIDVSGNASLKVCGGAEIDGGKINSNETIGDFDTISSYSSGDITIETATVKGMYYGNKSSASAVFVNNQSAKVTVTDATLIGGSSETQDSGDALELRTSAEFPAVITNSTLIGGDGGRQGGDALYLSTGAAAVVTGGTITGGQGTRGGYGVNVAGSITLTDVEIAGGASTTSTPGVGVYCTSPAEEVTIVGCEVTGGSPIEGAVTNSAGRGMEIYGPVTLSVENSAIRGGNNNRQGGDVIGGNAIWFYDEKSADAKITLTDVTLAVGNEADNGGAVISGTPDAPAGSSGKQMANITASGTLTLESGTLQNTAITPEGENGVTIVKEDGANVDQNSLTVSGGGHVESDGQTTYYSTASQAIENAKPGSTITITEVKEGEELPQPPAGATLENETGGEIQVGGKPVGPDGELTVYVAQVGETKYASLAEAIENATADDTIVLLEDITVSEPIRIEKNLIIDGNGKTITRESDGVVMNVLYEDGTDVTITGLTLKGNNGGGLLAWTMEEDYKENNTPEVTPKLTVQNCTFSSDDGQKTGAGIGLWGFSSNSWFNAAKSEVVIDDCLFDTLSVGIYYNEEAPLLNLKSTVTNNIFRNLSWTGIAGIPANAEIAHNTFENSCHCAIQYLLNANQTETNTSIHDNVIDSVVGIELMPYHLNEGNQNGDGETVDVTEKMLPSIKRNVRNTDTNLVKVVAYRGATDETLTLAEGAVIDLTENYTQGKAPTIQTVVQNAVGNNTAPSVETVTPEIKDDVYYEDSSMDPEDLNTYVPSSGGGTTTYAVTVDKADNGSVTASSSRASRGRTVTLTVKPDEGYELAKLTVTDRNGDEIELTEKADNKFTFKMPGSKVTVEASFRPVEPEVSFSDVPAEAWYAGAVQFVYEEGLMMGVSEAEFAPGLTTSRAMVATVLWRMAGCPVVNYAMDFEDVDPAAYYGEAVRWATSEGIVGGYGNGKFGSDDPISREQFAAMLWRYAGSPVVEGMALNEFSDSADINGYAVDAMRWAVSAGIIGGNDAGELTPQGYATRAQVAAMLMRFVESLTR